MNAKTPLIYAHIPPVFRTVVDLCRFEQGPQDLPHSVSVLSAALILYTLARSVVGLFTLPGGLAVLFGLIDTALLALTAVLALWVRHVLHRVVQTLVGCFAAGSVVSLVTIAGYSIVSMAPVPLLLLGLGHVLTFPLIVWNLALNAHILREALSTRLTVGLSVALVYVVILWQITEHIVKGALPH